VFRIVATSGLTVTEGTDSAGAGEARAKKNEVADDGQVATVEPEIIAVFVEHENFRGEARGERPFPLGHDGQRATDHAGHVVMVGVQLLVEQLAAGAVGIIGDAIDLAQVGAKISRHAAETGNQVGVHVRVKVVQAGQEFFVQFAIAAFDQQDAGERGEAFREEVAHRCALAQLKEGGDGDGEAGKERVLDGLSASKFAGSCRGIDCDGTQLDGNEPNSLRPPLEIGLALFGDFRSGLARRDNFYG
jgi:cation transport regulator ChaB